MAKVAVYRFLLLDGRSGQWRKQPGYATREYVEARQGALIFGSKLEIDATETRDAIYSGVPKRQSG